MKISLLTTLLLLGFFMSHGQTLKGSKSLNSKIQSSSTLSKEFKAISGPVLRADDDCTPPPCTGIIDPWTCECHPDIKDPWEDKALASKMQRFQRFESSVQKGAGKDLIPRSLVGQAKKRYPGNSLSAMTKRLNFYAKNVKR